MNTGLMKGPADASSLPELVRRGLRGWTRLSLSPDGQWVVYDSASGIIAARTGGDSGLVRLTSSRVALFPSVSPDGHWLAYMSDESGNFQVYVAPFPDVSRAKRMVSTVTGLMPKWSRDDKELFYSTYSGDFVAVQVLPGAAFSLGERQVLFKLDDLWQGDQISIEPAPDGRFLMLRPQQSNRPDELIIVENFLEEVRAKVKR
jgi:serine/threonine-protein kinase